MTSQCRPEEGRVLFLAGPPAGGEEAETVPEDGDKQGRLAEAGPGWRGHCGGVCSEPGACDKTWLPSMEPIHSDTMAWQKQQWPDQSSNLGSPATLAQVWHAETSIYRPSYACLSHHSPLPDGAPPEVSATRCLHSKSSIQIDESPPQEAPWRPRSQADISAHG